MNARSERRNGEDRKTFKKVSIVKLLCFTLFFKQAINLVMEKFLLTFVPVSNITVTTALYKRVRSGSWTGDYNKEVQNFVQTLERVKKLTSAEDKLRLDRFQSFGQDEELKQRVRIY